MASPFTLPALMLGCEVMTLSKRMATCPDMMSGMKSILFQIASPVGTFGARNVAMQNGVGIPSLVVSQAELRELQPQANWDDVAFAAYEPDSGYVDAIPATQGMARAARAAGGG